MADNEHQRLYDGLFVINPHEMGGNLSGALEHIQGMLNNAHAETLSLRKWDERQMAYPINGQKRGVYLLAIFRASPSQIANIQRTCNLSELVMRELVLSADHLGEVEIEHEAGEAQKTEDEASLTDENESGEEGEAQTEPAAVSAGTEVEPAGQSA